MLPVPWPAMPPMPPMPPMPISRPTACGTRRPHYPGRQTRVRPSCCSRCLCCGYQCCPRRPCHENRRFCRAYPGRCHAQSAQKAMRHCCAEWFALGPHAFRRTRNRRPGQHQRPQRARALQLLMEVRDACGHRGAGDGASHVERRIKPPELVPPCLRDRCAACSSAETLEVVALT